jgi:hypothetical protein
MERTVLTNKDLRSLTTKALFDSIYENVIISAEKGLTFYKFDVPVKYEKDLLEILTKYLPEVLVEKTGISQHRETYGNILYKLSWKD